VCETPSSMQSPPLDKLRTFVTLRGEFPCWYFAFKDGGMRNDGPPRDSAAFSEYELSMILRI